MKKLLSLLFTLSLCFVLVACGETTTPTESTPNSNEQTEATTSANDANKDEETVKAILLTDVWKTTENETAASYQSIVFHEDGTCIANGETRTWEIYHTNIGGSSLIIAKISIKNGVDTVFDFSLFDKEEYYLYTSGISFYLPDGFKAEKYKDLCQYLDNYRSSGSFYDGDTRTHYRDDAALAYLREGFAALGDYKDSATLLASLADAEKENKYNALCKYLNEYKNSADKDRAFPIFYVSELGKSLYDNEMLAYLREGFTSLGDYKDSVTLLASLADVEKKLQYTDLLKYLKQYKEKQYIDLWTDILYENEALAYLYEGFTSLGDYKDCAEILARFTVLSDMHAGITKEIIDNLGTKRSVDFKYEYDSLGRLICADVGVGITEEQWGVPDTAWSYWFEYSENNTIAQVYVKTTQLQAIIAPIYDEQGNMISANIKTNDSEHTNTYAYDEQGRCINSEIYTEFDGIKTYTYTYDANGNLIQKTCFYEDGYRKTIQTISYHYENGILASSTEKWEQLQGKYNSETQQYDSWEVYKTWNVKNEYTCDENGRILSVDIFDESETTYSSQKLIYNYETLYFYNEAN